MKRQAKKYILKYQKKKSLKVVCPLLSNHKAHNLHAIQFKCQTFSNRNSIRKPEKPVVYLCEENRKAAKAKSSQFRKDSK